MVLRVKKIGYFMCLQTDTVVCRNSHYLILESKRKNFHHDLVISFHAEFGDLISLSSQVLLGDLLGNKKRIQSNNSPFILVLCQAKPKPLSRILILYRPMLQVVFAVHWNVF